MNQNNFPNYFIAGDKASLKAQSTYTKYVSWDLFLMVFASALSIYNYETEDSKFYIYAISGFILIIATILSLVIKNKKYEDIWYRGRALAESCKTLTWRYITCSEYFENTLTKQQVERKFIDRIREINSEFNDISNKLNARDLALPIITNEMDRIRNLSLDDRKDYYLVNRINNQIDWYSNKAERNIKLYEIWFWSVIISQILAILSIVYLIKFPMSNFNFVGLLTTFSASCFSWLQLKKYQENKEAYTTATSELNMIKQELNEADTEEKFSKFVLDSENAMSREHTMWIAQKRN